MGDYSAFGWLDESKTAIVTIGRPQDEGLHKPSGLWFSIDCPLLTHRYTQQQHADTLHGDERIAHENIGKLGARADCKGCDVLVAKTTSHVLSQVWDPYVTYQGPFVICWSRGHETLND